MSSTNGWPARCALTDCAASTLAAAVTADMTMSASATAAAADGAQRTPIAAPARLSRSPAACGKRMSHAAIRSTPLAWRRPAAMAWPASPKPMKHSAGFISGILIFLVASALADDDRIGVDSAMGVLDLSPLGRGRAAGAGEGDRSL